MAEPEEFSHAWDNPAPELTEAPRHPATEKAWAWLEQGEGRKRPEEKREAIAGHLRELDRSLERWEEEKMEHSDAWAEREVTSREVPDIVTAGAKDGRDWFIAYLREGFTSEQAMRLVTRVIVNVPLPPAPRRWWRRHWWHWPRKEQ